MCAQNIKPQVLFLLVIVMKVGNNCICPHSVLFQVGYKVTSLYNNVLVDTL